MKKLDLYIIKEMFVPFLIGIFVIVLMFQANEYISIAKSLNLDYVPVLARFQWIVYRTPGFMVLTLPAGSAFAASLCVTRLARDSEITAMRVAGVPIMRIMVPVALFGVFAAIANFYLVEDVVPVAEQKSSAIINQTGALAIGMPSLNSGKFVHLNNYDVSFGSVIKAKDANRLKLRDILLIERTPNGITQIVKALDGTYDRGVWRFPDAVFYHIEGPDITGVQAKPVVINEPISVSEFYNPLPNEQLSTSALRHRIEDGLKMKQDVKAIQIVLYERYSVPTACFVFTIVAPVFAVYFSRSGGFTGVLVSFVMVLLYYNVMIISSMIMGKVEWVPAVVAAWLPNVLFGTLGLLAYRRIE